LQALLLQGFALLAGFAGKKKEEISRKQQGVTSKLEASQK
jgi:hypothetical protein